MRSTSKARPCSKRKMMRRLAVTVTLQKPARSPVSGCSRQPGYSAMSRGRAGTPRRSPSCNNRRRPSCRKLPNPRKLQLDTWPRNSRVVDDPRPRHPLVRAVAIGDNHLQLRTIAAGRWAGILRYAPSRPHPLARCGNSRSERRRGTLIWADHQSWMRDAGWRRLDGDPCFST